MHSKNLSWSAPAKFVLVWVAELPWRNGRANLRNGLMKMNKGCSVTCLRSLQTLSVGPNPNYKFYTMRTETRGKNRAVQATTVIKHELSESESTFVRSGAAPP